jgi:hypothetical protein
MARPFGTRKYTADQVADAVYSYLEKCRKENSIPLLLELAQELDVNKDTITEWQKLPEYSVSLKRVKDASELWMVKGVANEGKPIGKMFLLKANHGYVEKQHVTHSGTLNMAMILDQLEGKSTRELKEGEDYQVLDQLE